EFFGKPPSKNVHPDEAVAQGAAIQGAALVQDDQDVLLLDVTPHALGIMVHGGGFERLIEANTTIPTSHSHIFTTVRDNQTSVKIIVLQGDSDIAKENELLGEFVLSSLRAAPAGIVEVEVAFNISADGIVSVHAKDLETGKEQSITVMATSGLTEDEIQGMIQENEDYLVSLKEGEALELERARLTKLIREVERLVARLDRSTGAEVRDACESANAAVHNARGALSSRDFSQVRQALDALDRAHEVLSRTSDLDF
ncbi:MAG: Hsp70 family protein, partial [Myxococcota bacterium]